MPPGRVGGDRLRTSAATTADGFRTLTSHRGWVRRVRDLDAHDPAARTRGRASTRGRRASARAGWVASAPSKPATSPTRVRGRCALPARNSVLGDLDGRGERPEQHDDPDVHADRDQHAGEDADRQEDEEARGDDERRRQVEGGAAPRDVRGTGSRDHSTTNRGRSRNGHGLHYPRHVTEPVDVLWTGSTLPGTPTPATPVPTSSRPRRSCSVRRATPRGHRTARIALPEGYAAFVVPRSGLSRRSTASRS